MRGRGYLWTPDPRTSLGGRVTAAVVALHNLDSPDGDRGGRLWGRFVRVRNGGAVNEADPVTHGVRAVPIGDARPNPDGDFLFEPGRGGGRMDKVALAAPDFRWRYIQASHFGEVNTYFHLDRIATYVDELLQELGACSLPRAMAVVNAHHAATETGGIRDGVRRGGRWLPFQGGHYRLPSRRGEVVEHEAISPDGEIHVGPGWQLVEHGAIAQAAGGRYRANASHNAGILYHEYGHHITRHTADFQANALRRPDRQSNRKTAIDEAICDYWAATLLETPHIWAWHKRHDAEVVHPRSLTSSKTMADCAASPAVDAHADGTILASALWDMRMGLRTSGPDGARSCDLLVLQSLLLMGARIRETGRAAARMMRLTGFSFAMGLQAFLQADELLNGGRHRDRVISCFAARGIRPAFESKPVKGRLCSDGKIG